MVQMLIAPRTGFVFVHVQKTGGLTVDSVLREVASDAEHYSYPGYGRHAGLEQLLSDRPECADYFIFGFIRNPWARMYSWWAMIQRRQQSALAGNTYVQEQLRRNSFWRRVLAEFPDFESFILKGVPTVDRLGTPQLSYLSAPSRKADFIGRTEELSSDLRQVLQRLGIDREIEVPRRNAAPAVDYRNYYTLAMRETVATAFEPDVAHFGYQF
jgi:hypothetical protein